MYTIRIELRPTLDIVYIATFYRYRVSIWLYYCIINLFQLCSHLFISVRKDDDLYYNNSTQI